MCITINHGISIEAFSYHSFLNLFISNLPEFPYQLLVIFVTNDKQSLSKKKVNIDNLTWRTLVSCLEVEPSTFRLQLSYPINCLYS